jgi:hypothetical protein
LLAPGVVLLGARCGEAFGFEAFGLEVLELFGLVVLF